MTIDDDIDYSEIDGPEDRQKYLGTVEVPEDERIDEYQGETPVTEVTDQMLREDATDPTSWLQYNGNLAQTGYAPADRLTTDNVGDLSVEYAIETESRGLETNPVVVPGDPPQMYFTQRTGLLLGRQEEREAQNFVAVRAVNARTGEEFWTAQYEMPENVSRNNEAIRVNRGVAVYGDKVYVGTADTKLVAFDRASGETVWETSLLLEGQEQPRVSFTEAPVAYDGKLFIGQAGDANGWTAVLAVDAESGEILWEQPTVDRDAWVGETWKFSSASGWMSPTVDAESDTVFWSLGNPDPMLNGLVRPGPNTYSNSVIALDANTGEIKWNHQLIPHELWDYDVHTTPMVFDIEVDGERRRVVTTDWKAGWTYMIDVETGDLIDRSSPFARQGGETFLEMPPAGADNAETMSPTTTGATEWPPDAYSRKTGYKYLGVTNATTEVWYDPDWAWGPDNYDAYGGGAEGLLEGNSAEVVAMDQASGDIVWSHELEDVESNWPDVRLFPGGNTATGGNVVFHGSSGGHMIALDAETGEKLWQHDTGGRITASPVVWDDPDDGKQYVSVAADNRIVTYSVSGE